MNGITVWDGFGHTLLGIIEALAPLLVLFIIFQLTVLKLPRSYVFNLLKGSILALAGLALFLQGVHIGFFPAGEAMACKTPVVSTTGGALPEVVGDAGVLVPPGDAKAMEHAIVSLLDDPERRHRLGEDGYQRVHEHFTWKRAAERMVAVYREAMNANGRFLEDKT